MNQLSYYENYLTKKRKYELMKTQYKILAAALKQKSIQTLSIMTQNKYVQFMKVYQDVEDAYNLSAINVNKTQNLERPMTKIEYDFIIQREQSKYNALIEKNRDKEKQVIQEFFKNQKTNQIESIRENADFLKKYDKNNKQDINNLKDIIKIIKYEKKRNDNLEAIFGDKDDRDLTEAGKKMKDLLFDGKSKGGKKGDKEDEKKGGGGFMGLDDKEDKKKGGGGFMGFGGKKDEQSKDNQQGDIDDAGINKQLDESIEQGNQIMNDINNTDKKKEKEKAINDNQNNKGGQNKGVEQKPEQQDQNVD